MAAHAVLGEIAAAVSNWDVVARRNGIAEAEIARFDRTLTQTFDVVRGG